MNMSERTIQNVSLDFFVACASEAMPRRSEGAALLAARRGACESSLRKAAEDMAVLLRKQRTGTDRSLISISTVGCKRLSDDVAGIAGLIDF